MDPARVSQITETWKAFKQKEHPEMLLTQQKILADSVGFLLKECSAMTFNHYQFKAKSTAIYPKDKALDYCAMKLASEAGEVAGSLAKRHRDDKGNLTPKRQQELKKEIGDVLWYCAMLAYELGFTLGEVAQANVEKLADRKKRGTLKGNGDNR